MNALQSDRRLLPERLARHRARIGSGVAGVVDQQIDAAELFVRARKHRAHAVEAGDVALRRERRNAQRLDLGRHRGGAIGEVVVHHHAGGVRSREVEGGLAAHSLAGSGHQSDASLKIEDPAAALVGAHVTSSLPFRRSMRGSTHPSSRIGHR